MFAILNTMYDIRILQVKARCSVRPVHRTSCSKTACAQSVRGPSTMTHPRSCASRAMRRAALATDLVRSAVRPACSRCTLTGRTLSACRAVDCVRMTIAAAATRTPASVTT